MSFNEWKKVKLKDIGDIVTGKTPSTKNENYYGGEYLFITPRDMLGDKNIISTERTLSEEGIISVSKQVLKGSSICVSCIGSDMGKVIITDNGGVTNQQINSITNIKDIYNIDFIYYTLKPMKEYLHNIAGGSTMPIVNKSTFGEIEINIPTIEEQKAIAKILSDLDNKIELNNKINKRLEDMAQSIFKHWFVDFEFPNEEGQSYKSSGGEMVESELGMIPKGWEVKKVEEITKIIRGASPRPIQEYIRDKGMPWIKISDATQSNSKYICNTKEFIKEEGISKSRFIKKGTLILSNSATPGIPKIVNIDACVHDGWLIFNDFKGISKEYMYYFLLNEREGILNLSNGSVFRNLKTDILKSYKIIVPTTDVLGKIQGILEDINNTIRCNVEANERIEKLRDTILPKLMSGEIRVGIDKTND